uniref:ribosomal protein L3 n=1 Tax=Ochrosphaera neapolitana TaxID=35137 RepID=UPI00286D007B|nr:ribosomal protein L3 [Ochrosphaera neapolitana]WKK50136.1 ribosomal protein L3 [Ochrosphaera neapolitana]
MTIGVFGRKIGMTHIFDENGFSIAVTLVKAEDCLISQIKNPESDGYHAIQLAYGKASLKNINKPTLGHLAEYAGDRFRYFGEFRTDANDSYNIGDRLTVEVFQVGQKVKVTGKSIGKGFSGNQKRHNFHRGPMTHGSKNHRLPGSVGAGSTPGRVYPGKKMAGQLGNATTTMKTSEILHINTTDNLLVLKGSLPGKENNLLKISTKS